MKLKILCIAIVLSLLTACDTINWTTVTTTGNNSNKTSIVNSTTQKTTFTSSIPTTIEKSSAAVKQVTTQVLESKVNEPKQPERKEITVFITKTGHKYHRSGCRYLSRSCILVSLDEAKNEGYVPCSICNLPY